VVLRESSGKHFDPQIVDVFFNELEEIKEIQKTYREQATPFEWPIDSPGETEPLLAAV
jgi:HD-GYP domain-containing protein (c-di-GMP phosphodiesterase class II)